MPSPLLSLTAVRKSYGSRAALKDVTLSAAGHQLLVVLGPNGAGKSTLVQLMTGLFVPDAGRIEIAGHDMARAPVQALRSMGVVFQQPTLDLELTVTGNLRFHADLHGLDRAVAGRRIEEVLDRFGLADRAGDRARTLSGGNRRRLELARALLHRPSILIMDEPTVGLDPRSREDLMQHVLDLRARDGLLVVWTSHFIDEAERADRLIFLSEGALVFDGASSQALSRSGAATLNEAFLSMTSQPLSEAGPAKVG